jgi:predicted metal-dependent hydrolase
MRVLHGAIDYGGRRLAYAARFTNRKTLAISVRPDQSIEIVAPSGTPRAKFEQRLRKRAGWVCRQIRFFEQFTPRTPPRRYVSGETRLYLGKQYLLRICKGPAEGVRLIGGHLEVTIQDRENSHRVRDLVDSWYRKRAQARLSDRFAVILTSFRLPEKRRPRLQIRVMQRRWGSHKAGKTITLNPNLIRAPTRCIEYVITHELCHVVQPHHDASFFRLLAKRMPDWRERKTQLERLLA